VTETNHYPELKRKLTPGWWTANGHYVQYMVREWTSLFVALFSLVYIYGLSLWVTGSRTAFLNLLKNPAMITFSFIALIFTLYHAVTWFYLLGQVVPMKIGKTTTKPWQALAVNIVLMLIVSYLVVWMLVLR
jgi:fumarate reductase subunit C